MKERKDKSRVPILAAGGIVLRNDRTPQFAVVQLRKLGAWGLPKGKLAPGEDAIAAARREVLEETGHRVTIHEFLGTLAYEASGRPKVVQFWRMEAIGEPIGDLTWDVTAVRWLGLEDAIDRLTHLRERVFLEQVGPVALNLAERSARRAAFRGQPAESLPYPPPQAREGRVEGRRALSAPGMRTIGKVVPLAPLADGAPLALADPSPQAGEEAAADALTLAEPSWQTPQERGKEAAGRGLIEKTWVWFRSATTAHRQPLD